MRPQLFIVLMFLCAADITTAQVSRSPDTKGLNAGFNVRDFGARGDGTTLDTAPIQSAVQAAHQAGGGTVILGPGVYRSGTIELLSNVTLDLEPGAVLRGSSNIEDYRPIADFGFARDYGVNSTGEGFRLGILVARDVENVAIVGRGTIDGISEQFFDDSLPHYSMDFDPKSTRQGEAFLQSVLSTGDGPIQFRGERPGTMIAIMNARNVLMRDITLRHSPNWTVHFQSASRVNVQGVHVDNDVRVPNNDGFDCMACRDAHFSDLDIRTGDDDFAIVGSEDVTVTNCSMTSYSSAIRIEDTRYATFNNLSIHANRGIGIYERGKGTSAHLLFSSLAIETFLLTGHWWGKGEPIYLAVGEANGTAGRIDDVRFSDATIEAENGMVLYGDPKGSIENVGLDHVDMRLRITRPQVNAQVGGNLDLRWTAPSAASGIVKHDNPGLYARFVNGLTIDGFRLDWGRDMPAWYSSAMEVEDVQELDVNRFRGRQANASSLAPVIDLHRIKGVAVRNSTAAQGSSTFIAFDRVSSARVIDGNDLHNARRAFNGNANATMRGNINPAVTRQQ